MQEDLRGECSLFPHVGQEKIVIIPSIISCYLDSID